MDCHRPPDSRPNDLTKACAQSSKKTGTFPHIKRFNMGSDRLSLPLSGLLSNQPTWSRCYCDLVGTYSTTSETTLTRPYSVQCTPTRITDRTHYWASSQDIVQIAQGAIRVAARENTRVCLRTLLSTCK